MATTRVVGRGPVNPVDEEFLKQLYQGGELLAQGGVHECGGCSREASYHTPERLALGIFAGRNDTGPG